MFKTRRQHELAVVKRYIAEARRRGRSHFQKQWQSEDFRPSALDGLVEAMVDWCRVTMGSCRRPYGIDFFDLIVSYRFEREGKERSFRLNRLEPMALYQESLPEQLLERLTKALTAAEAPKVYVSAGVFSWGNAAYKVLDSTSTAR